MNLLSKTKATIAMALAAAASDVLNLSAFLSIISYFEQFTTIIKMIQVNVNDT